MSNPAGARAVEKMIQQYGCLPAMPDGQEIPGYERAAFIEALTAEIQRCFEYGMPKLTIHMTLPDAVRLRDDMRTL